MNLRYRADLVHDVIDGLALNECTIHRARNAAGVEWWILWFYVARETDGVPERFEVAINPGGGPIEKGPQGGHVWGLTRTAADTWQIAPSINVLDTRAVHPGPHPTLGSLWHQTPAIVGVPAAGEPWMP